MVAIAPPWRKVAAWIVGYVGPDTLICHNAGFNIGVLRHACTAAGIPWPRVDFLCTMILARRAFRLPSYRLPFVAAECGVELSGRHQVLINARGAALVTVALARQHQAATSAELADALAIRILTAGRGVRDNARYAETTETRSGQMAFLENCPERDVRQAGRDTP
jgi:DNA polymerase-3 subunit epsilon